jgi:GDP-D-mannose dehydratase
VLEGLLACADRFIRVEVDPARLRQTDIPRQEGDASKLRRHTHWEPTIPFEQSLQDLLNYERENFK